MKQINCSFRNHICMASRFSLCQAGGNSDFFFSLQEVWGPIRKPSEYGNCFIRQRSCPSITFLSGRWPLMEAGVGFWTTNTSVASGRRGHSFLLCDPMKGLGDGRKVIAKCKALRKPRKRAQPCKLQGPNHVRYPCSRVCTHTRAPDYVFKTTPHIGVVTLFRLMTSEIISAITARKMISTI